MKSEKRHQLEQNDLADWIQKVVGRSQSYLPVILVGLALMGAVFLFFGFRSGSNRQERQDAWKEFFAAANAGTGQLPMGGGVRREFGQFEILVDDESYVDTPAVAYAKLRIADFEFEQGRNRLTQDKGAARRALDEAIDLYKEFSSDHPDVGRQAALGLGMALETRGKIDEAIKTYKRVTTNYAGFSEAKIAEERVEVLKTEKAKKFYEQLANYEPTEEEPEPSVETSPVPSPPADPVSEADPPAIEKDLPKPASTETESSESPSQEDPKPEEPTGETEEKE